MYVLDLAANYNVLKIYNADKHDGTLFSACQVFVASMSERTGNGPFGGARVPHHEYTSDDYVNVLARSLA